MLCTNYGQGVKADRLMLRAALKPYVRRDWLVVEPEFSSLAVNIGNIVIYIEQTVSVTVILTRERAGRCSVVNRETRTTVGKTRSDVTLASPCHQ
jgi:hypothetical protein